MHNYTLQCFGTIAALTNEKGLHLAAFPLSTGSYVGLLAVPNCLKSLKLEGMAIGLKWTDDGLFMALSRGDFWCNLIAHGAVALRDNSTEVIDWDWSATGDTGYFDPPKPAPGAELLKLVPASHKKAAKYMPEYGFVSCGFLTVTKTTNHTEVQRTVLKTVDYWGAVEPLKGLIKPPTKACTTVRIEFDGKPIILGYDNAKLVEKLSKKATFGLSTLGHLVAHLDGILYIFSGLDPKTKPYITLTLNTVMEQVA